MKKIALAIGVLLVISVLAFVIARNKPDIASNIMVKPSPTQPTVTINSHTYTIEIADTSESQQQGLSDRTSLPQEHGMLFIFPEKQVRSFWMKDMHFPLDMIWIDGDTIVDITENVPPPTPGESPAIVYPKAPVDKVLELNAGEVKRIGVSAGQKVLLSIDF